MTDYIAYCGSKCISNNQVISTVKVKFPSFSKIQASMIKNPEKYAVCLVPEAEQLLADKYGYGSGLSIRPRGRRVENRAKKNRLTVRVSDELNNRVRDLMYKLGFNTTQDFLEAALTSMVEQDMGGNE